MKNKGKYNINITITNEIGTKIVNIDFDEIKLLEEKLGKLEKAIKKYDKENYKKCHQCLKYNHISDMTSPEEMDDVLIDNKCIEQIMSGETQLRDAAKVL